MMSIKDLIRDLIIEWCVYKGKNNKDTCAQWVNEAYLEKESNVADKIYSELSNSDEGKLVILKAPTGAGKTEILSSIFLYQWLVEDWFVGR
ncbi:MAG: hypothetical protein ACP5NQ_08005, partial [Vulcanisaeta sp.]